MYSLDHILAILIEEGGGVNTVIPLLKIVLNMKHFFYHEKHVVYNQQELSSFLRFLFSLLDVINFNTSKKFIFINNTTILSIINTSLRHIIFKKSVKL